MVATALFAALAFLTVFVFRIYSIGGFLTFEAKDAVLTICGMFFGPLSGIAAALIVTLIEMVTISSTGPWGFLMNFLASGTFVFVASFIYNRKRTFKNAILGLIAASLSMTAIMLVANILITPLYMHVTVEAVIKLLPGTILPFNLLKTMTNSGVVLLLYKPLSSALKAAHILPGSHPTETKTAPVNPRRSLFVTIIAVALIVVSICVFVFVLNGSFSPPA